MKKGAFLWLMMSTSEILGRDGNIPKMNTQKCSLTKGQLLAENALYTVIYLVRSTGKELVICMGVVVPA